MTLENSYLLAYNELKERLMPQTMSSKEAISLIDLTLLEEAADDETLSALCKKANLNQVAAVCVLPQHLKKIELDEGIQLATVVNFPEGIQSTSQVLSAIDHILTYNLVDEMDYVFPHQTYLEGDKQAALLQCQLAYDRCQQAKVCFKVILETGALPSLEFIYSLSTEILSKGCDFLKTSTGKIAQGATPATAFSILQAIKNSKMDCGLKVSGGIKTPEQAFIYMGLAKQILERDLNKSWFRIGASSLLDSLNSRAR